MAGGGGRWRLALVLLITVSAAGGGGHSWPELTQETEVVDGESQGPSRGPWLSSYRESADFRWNGWQPWVCMCDIRKQARIRHFVVSSPRVDLNLTRSDFWQEKPCSARDCPDCGSGECPLGNGRLKMSWFNRPDQTQPAPPSWLLPTTRFQELGPYRQSFGVRGGGLNSYESLPVIDDV